MRTADFEYELPEGLIAQTPAARRADARLLVLHRESGALAHHLISDLPALLAPGDLLVVNDTRVLPARLFARRQSGARIEVLLLRPAAVGPEGQPDPTQPLWQALLRPARRVRAEERLAIEDARSGSAAGDGPGLRLVGRLEDGVVLVRFEGRGAEDVPALLRARGEMPLPPYIHTRAADPGRYQTVYARADGSAAAPTAGLHFTPELFAALTEAGVDRTALTLHVGLGTFRPVATEDVQGHRMHSEWFEVPVAASAAIGACRTRGGRVVAVGTTVVRSLESQARPGRQVAAGSGWTDMFIVPGRPFGVVDALLTNFHLPRSTLLMLVCAFGGTEAVLAAYREAVRLQYRFFSFGDAMLIL